MSLESWGATHANDCRVFINYDFNCCLIRFFHGCLGDDDMNDLCKHCPEKEYCIMPCQESLEKLEKAERLEGKYKPVGIGRIMTKAEKDRCLSKGLRV